MPHEKRQGVYRILVLGDSFTFGQGIKDLHDTYPKLLEQKLNQKSNITFEVINAGKRGSETYEEFNFLNDKGIKYSPDLIILGYMVNDIVYDLVINNQEYNNYVKQLKSSHPKMFINTIYRNSYLLCLFNADKLVLKLTQLNTVLGINSIKGMADNFNSDEMIHQSYTL